MNFEYFIEILYKESDGNKHNIIEHGNGESDENTPLTEAEKRDKQWREYMEAEKKRKEQEEEENKYPR